MHANFYLLLSCRSVKRQLIRTRQTFSFIDFKDVVSKLVSYNVALHAESKTIIFTRGPLFHFFRPILYTFGKEAG